MYGERRRHLGDVFRQFARQKESRIEEGHLLSDHVRMLIAIPPKYAVAKVIGFIKGKSAIHLARVYGERKCNFVEQHFWLVLRVERGPGRVSPPGVHPEAGTGRRRCTRPRLMVYSVTLATDPSADAIYAGRLVPACPP